MNGCDNLPEDIVYQMIENEAKDFSTSDCSNVRKICKDPTCREHCTKKNENVAICREVMKTSRCLQGIKEYKIIRTFIFDRLNWLSPEVEFDLNKEPLLSYFHKILLNRIIESGGLYNVIMGDITDTNLDDDIQIASGLLKEEGLSTQMNDRFKKELLELEEEKEGLTLPKVARPKQLTATQRERLETMYQEKDDKEDDEWVKYTMKQCIQVMFPISSDMFNEICYFFEDHDTLDDEGNDLWDKEELPESWPNGIMFLDGHWIMDIDEGLHYLFKGSDELVMPLLEKFEKEDTSRINQEKKKQQFLLMMVFLDDIYMKDNLS